MMENVGPVNFVNVWTMYWAIQWGLVDVKFILKYKKCELNLGLYLQIISIKTKCILGCLRTDSKFDINNLISGVNDSIGTNDDGQELLIERQNLVVFENEGVLTLTFFVTLNPIASTYLFGDCSKKLDRLHFFEV